MFRDRSKLYIHATSEKQEIVFSGIGLREVLPYIQPSLKNLLILKGNYIGDDCKNGFEVVEGEASIQKFAEDYVDSYGDFCFVDFERISDIEDLTDIEISELLFLAHMWRPLQTAFFEHIHNRFVYLAHDDGWCCKMYCRNLDEFSDVYINKILSFIKRRGYGNLPNIDKAIQQMFASLTEKGVIVDFDDIEIDGNKCMVYIYIVGKYTDVDDLFNRLETVKQDASEQIRLCYDGHDWVLLES